MPPRAARRAPNDRYAPFRAIVARVPRGRVVTYGDVARAAGVPGGARWTVAALRNAGNLPWHRVVAAGGRIALSGIDGEEQRLRLRLEGVAFRGAKVRLDTHRWTPTVSRRRTRASAPGASRRRRRP